MGMLDFLTKKSSSPAAVVRQLCEIVRPPLGSTYTDENSVNKYRSWVYVASNHNANNIADGEIKLYSNTAPKASRSKSVTNKELKQIQSYGVKAHKSAVEIEEHPILDLLSYPNAEDTAYSFLYKIDLFLEITGDSYVLIERNDAGIPIALHVLFSQYMSIQTDGRNQVTHYNYGIARDGKWQFQYPPEDIIHFKFFDPANVHYGISPLEASARSYGLIQSMDTYEEALNRNLGVPSGILKYSNQQIKADDRAVIEKKWQQKFSSVGRAGKVVVTDQDVEYNVLGVSPREMQFLDGRKWSREEILSCFGVNPALILTESVNRSNMEQASINYYHNTLRPRFKLISQTLTNQLILTNGIDGRNMFVTVSKSEPADSELTIQKSELLASTGSITVNELRTNMGMELLIVGGDDLVSTTGNLIGVTNNEV